MTTVRYRWQINTAMKVDGRDNGVPGVRSHYHPHYYGAFVLDPDGYNITAVFKLIDYSSSSA